MTIALTDDEALRAEAFGIHKRNAPPVTIQLVADAERAERTAEKIRARLAPAPTAGQIKTPDSMIEDLEWAKHGAGQIALVLKDVSNTAREARRVFARAHATALWSSAGKSAELREADAALACEGEQIALDVAETALEFAKNVARSIEQTGSMTQTQAGLVKTTLNLAGTGRGES